MGIGDLDCHITISLTNKSDQYHLCMDYPTAFCLDNHDFNEVLESYNFVKDLLTEKYQGLAKVWKKTPFERTKFTKKMEKSEYVLIPPSLKGQQFVTSDSVNDGLFYVGFLSTLHLVKL